MEDQNHYEREWKIKTNMNKFSIVPVFRRKSQEFIIKKTKNRMPKKNRILGFKSRR